MTARAALLALLLALPASASAEVPPVIIGVREAMRDARRALNADAARHAVADTGGVCEALPEVEDDDMPERAEVERHLAACSRTGRHSDPWAVLRLVQLEHELGAPSGLLSAAVCFETGYRPGARGDWLAGHARAHGWFQMHAPWERVCRLARGGRDSIEAATRCYWWRVTVRAEEAKACTSPLVVGEALAANVVRYRAWGCQARSRHNHEMEGWQ